MFEPDEQEETGMRVKQPLASFLAKFKQVRQLPVNSSACQGDWKNKGLLRCILY